MKGLYEVKIQTEHTTYRHKLRAKSFDHAARRVCRLDMCQQDSIRSVKFISA